MVSDISSDDQVFSDLAGTCDRMDLAVDGDLIVGAYYYDAACPPGG